jgi:hypothetical protein
MQPTFSSGADISTWGTYGIEEIPIQLNGNSTKYKAILQGGELAQIATQSYTVLPNEEAVKIAEQAAHETGLVPFHEFTGDWFVRMGNNVIKDGWKVHALYAINKQFKIAGDKKGMHIGVGVHNAIDGSAPFGAGIFTFRNACANMVLAGSRGYTQSFDERKTLDYIYKRHVGELETVLQDLTTKITNLMDRAQTIVESYNQMAQRKVDEDFRRDFIQGLKKNYLPQKFLPDYLRVDKEQKLLPLTSDLTVWNVYNDITAAIWHSPKTGLDSKIDEFNALHKLIPLTVN